MNRVHVLALGVVIAAAAVMFAIFVKRAPRGSTPPARASLPALVPHASASSVAPAPPEPRLTASGFEGMSLAEMASLDRVRAAFPSAWTEQQSDTRIEMIAAAAPLATIHLEDGKAESVHVVAKGIATEHALSVGDPLANVLAVKGRRHCETLWQVANSGLSSYGFIRCWVGPEPAHLRYVADVDEAANPPSNGAALERWIRDAKQPLVIDQIIWHAAPDREF